MTHFTNGSRALALLAIAITTGCAPAIHVTTELAPNADPSRFSLYIQEPPPLDDPSRPRFTQAIGERMAAEIDRVLTSKGYRKATADQAELVVSFVVTGESQRRWVNLSDPSANRKVRQDYTDGTLVVTVFDPQGKQLWEGTAMAEIVTTASTEEYLEEIALEALRKVLAELPDSRAGA